jgi:protein PhnA
MTESSAQKCPSCQSPDCYSDGTLWICPLCNHEWTEFGSAQTGDDHEEASPDATVVKDANGNRLQDGDAVVVIKDLPVKGASGPIKGGTKVKSIRITHDVPGHNIVCKIDGFGQIHLKSQYVKKA